MSSSNMAFIKETLVNTRFLAYHIGLAFGRCVSVFDPKSSLMKSTILNCGATNPAFIIDSAPLSLSE